MKTETRLALAAFGCAAVAPCTFGLSTGPGILLAVAGIVVAWREERSVVASVLALLANLAAIALLALLAALMVLALVLGALFVAAMEFTTDTAAYLENPVASVDSLRAGTFWSTYRRDLLVDHDGREGFFGGHCYLHWRAKSPERFDADEVTRFAVGHGWRLHAREDVRVGEMNWWNPTCMLPEGQCIEPKNHEPGELSPGYLGIHGPLRRDPDALFTVMAFDSGMYDHSDLESTRRSLTGFISISADGRDLFVAHNWGE